MAERTFEVNRGGYRSSSGNSSKKEIAELTSGLNEAASTIERVVTATQELNKQKLSSYADSVKKVIKTLDTLNDKVRKTETFQDVLKEYNPKDTSVQSLNRVESKIKSEMTSLAKEIQLGVSDLTSSFSEGNLDDGLASAIEAKIERYGQLTDRLLSVHSVLKSEMRDISEANTSELFSKAQEKALLSAQQYAESLSDFEERVAQFNPYKGKNSKHDLFNKNVFIDEAKDELEQLEELRLDFIQKKNESLQFAMDGGDWSSYNLDQAYEYIATLEEINDRINTLKVQDAQEKLGKNIIDVEGINRSLRSIDSAISRIEKSFKLLSSGGNLSELSAELSAVSQEEDRASDGFREFSNSLNIDDDHLDKLYLVIEKISDLLSDLDVNKFRELFKNLGTDIDPFINKLNELTEATKNIKMDFKMDFGKVATGGKSAASIASQQGEMRSDLIEDMLKQKRAVEEYITSMRGGMNEFVLGSPYAKGSQAISSANAWLEKFSDKEISNITSNTGKITRLKQFFSQVQEIGEFWNNKQYFGKKSKPFDFSEFKLDFTEDLKEIDKVADTSEEVKKKMQLVRESMSSVFGGGMQSNNTFNMDISEFTQQINGVVDNLFRLYDLTNTVGANGFRDIATQLVGETGEFQTLEGAVDAVTKAIDNKNIAIEKENQIVSGVVDSEITLFDALTGTIILVEEQIENLISSIEQVSSSIESNVSNKISQMMTSFSPSDVEKNGVADVGINIKPTMSSVSKSISTIENKLWTYPFKIEVTPILSNQTTSMANLQDQLLGKTADSTSIAKKIFSDFNIEDSQTKTLMYDSMNQMMSDYLKYGVNGIDLNGFHKKMYSAIFDSANIDPNHLPEYGYNNFIGEYESEVIDFYKKYKNKISIGSALGDLTKDEISEYKKYFSTSKRALNVDSIYESLKGDFPSIFSESGLTDIINPAEQIKQIKSIFDKAKSIMSQKKLNSGGLLPAYMLGEDNEVLSSQINNALFSAEESLFKRADSVTKNNGIKIPVEVDIPNSVELFEKINSQLSEIQGIVNELDLTKLEQLGDLDGFQRLIEILSGFKNVKNVEGLSASLSSLGEALATFNESTSNINESNITFLDELNKLAANGENLKYLATVLKASKKQMDNAKKAIQEEEAKNAAASELQGNASEQTNINNILTDSVNTNTEALNNQVSAIESVSQAMNEQAEASSKAADETARGAEKQVEAYTRMEEAQREALDNDLELTKVSRQYAETQRGLEKTRDISEYASSDKTKNAKVTTFYTTDKEGNLKHTTTLDVSKDVELEEKLAKQAEAQEKSVAMLRENNKAIASGALKEFNAEENERVTNALGKLDNATVNAKTGIATLTFRKEGESVEVFKVQVEDLADALIQLKQVSEGITTGPEILQALGSVAADGSVVSKTSISRSALSRSIDEKWAGKSATMSKNLGKFLQKYRGNSEIESLKEFKELDSRWDSLNAKGISDNLNKAKEDINDENYSGLISKFEQETERLRKALTDRIKVLKESKAEAARIKGIDSNLFSLISGSESTLGAELGTLKSVSTNENGITTLKFTLDDGGTIKTTTVRLTELDSILEDTAADSYKLKENIDLRSIAGSGYTVSTARKPGEKAVTPPETKIKKYSETLENYKVLTRNVDGYSEALTNAENILNQMKSATSKSDISRLSAEFEKAIFPIKEASEELKAFEKYSQSVGGVEEFAKALEDARVVLEVMGSAKDKVDIAGLREEFDSIVEPIKKAMRALEDFGLVRQKINEKLKSLSEVYASDLDKLDEEDPIKKRLNQMIQDTGNDAWNGRGSNARASIDFLRSDFAKLKSDIEGLGKGKFAGVTNEIRNLFSNLGKGIDLSPLIKELEAAGINLEDYGNDAYRAIERNEELSKSFNKIGVESVNAMIKEAKASLSTFTTKAATENGLNVEGENFRKQLDGIIQNLERLKTELNSGGKSRTLEELTKQAQDLNTQLYGPGGAIPSIGGRGSNAFVMARGDKVAGLTNKLAKWKSSNSKAMNRQEVADWYNSIVEGYNASDKTVANVEKFSTALNRLDTSVNEAGLNGLGLMDTLKNRARGFVGWMSIYLNAFTIINKVKEGIETVRELDTAFVEMQKVSNDTYSSLENYRNISFDLGDTVGTTGLQMQKSAADWMRLGENIDQAKESAAISNELLNISEFENIDAATESLVAVSQAYQDLDKIQIVDKLNNIGNNFSISTDQLAEGLQKASATLLTQGNDINEAAALITAGNNTIQNAASVAAGIKTISLRIAGTKEGEEKLAAEGEDTSDYVVTTVSKKRGVIKNYTAVASNKYEGVDILDANGNYKSTYEILKEISEVYQEIQEEDKKFGTNRAAALIEELAGKNRSNIAAAILQNGELLQKVYDYSIDSEGSAQEELDRHLDSIAGKTTQLTNKAQEFASIVIPTDMFKGVLDVANDLLDTINKILSLTGGIPGVLGALVGGTLGATGHDVLSFLDYMKTATSTTISGSNITGQIPYSSTSFFRSTFGGAKEALFGKRAKVSMNVSDYFNRQGLLGNSTEYSLSQWKETAEIIGDMNFSKYIEGLEEAKVQTLSGAEAMDGYKASLLEMEQTTTLVGSALSSLGAIAKSVIATFATMAVSMAVFALIGKAWNYIDENVIHRIDNLKEAGEKAQSSFDSLTESYNKTSTSISEIAGKYAENAEGGFKKTEDAVDALAKKYGELREGVSIDGSNISLSNSEYEEFLGISNQLADLFPTLVTGYDAQGNAILSLGDNASEAAEKISNLIDKEKEHNAIEMVKEMNTAFEGQMAEFEELSSEANKNQMNADYYKKANVDSSIKELIDSHTGEIVKVADLQGKKLVDLSDGLLRSYISQVSGIEEQSITEGTFNDYKNAFKEFGTEFGKVDNDTAKEMESALRAVATNEAKQEDIWSSVASNISNVLPSKKEFSNLDSTMQNLISSNVESLVTDYGYGRFKENYLDKGKGGLFDKLLGKHKTLDDFVYEQIIAPLNSEKFTDDIKLDLSTLFDKGYTEKSLPQFAARFSEILSKAFDVGSDEYNNMVKLFGMDKKMEDYSSGLQKASDKVTDFKNHAQDLANLSQEDFSIMVQLIDDGFQGSYNKLVNEINEINKKKIDIDVTPLDIDTLLEDEDSAISRVTKAFGEDAKEKGDTYAQVLTYLDTMKELYKNGDIGTEKFKSLAAYFSPTGSDDAANYKENLSKINRYFTKDSNKGIYNFMDDLIKTLSDAGYKEAGVKDGMYHLPTYFDADKIGRKMGIGGEVLTTLLGEAMDKGMSNDFFTDAESGMDTIVGLQEDLVDAQLRLNKLRKEDPNNKTAIDAQEEKVKQLTDRIKEAKSGLDTFLNAKGKKKKSTFDEDVKDINQAIKDYKAMDKEYSKGGKTNKLWEDRKKDYEHSIIKAGQEAGLNTGYNKRGKLVADVDSSNKQLTRNARLVDAYKENGKVTKKLTEAMAKYNLSSDKESDIQKFIDTYGKENWLDAEEISKMNADAFATETEKQTSDLVAAIEAIAPSLADTLGPYLDPNYNKDKNNEEKNNQQEENVLKDKEDNTPKERGKIGNNPLVNTVKKFLDGTYLRDGLNSIFDGEGAMTVDASEVPEEYAESINKVEDALKSEGSEAKKSIETIGNYTEEQLRSADLTGESSDQMSKDFMDLMDSLDLSYDSADKLIEVLSGMGLLKVEPKVDLSGVTSIDQLNDKLSSELESGQSVTYSAHVEGVEGDAQIKALENVDGTITYTAKDLDGVEKEVEPVAHKDGTITYKFVPDKGSKKDKDGKKNEDGGTITQQTDVDTSGFEKGKKQIEQGVHTLSGETAKPQVDLQGATYASNKLREIKNEADRLNGKKSTLTIETIRRQVIEKKYNNTHKSEGGNTKQKQFNGTFHASSAYAGGTDVSLSNDQTALINELGEEIVVRNGKAITFNNGYPTFAKLKRGDIIFNHKQSQELEENGYVTGSHAKVYGGGSAFANGTFISDAFSTGMPTKKKSSSKKTKSSTTKNTDSGNGNKGTKKKGRDKKNSSGDKKWEQFEKWLGQFFDWIEIRLDALSDKTEKWTNLFEKFLNASSANAQRAYDAAISAARTQQSQSGTASDRYLQQALKVGYKGADKAGKKVTRSWVNKMYQRILDGSLDKNALQRLSEKRKGIIKAMQGYIDKAKDASDSTIELTDSINELIKKQRDAKVEFKKNALTTSVEGDTGYLASTKNRTLSASSSVARYSNATFNTALQNQYSELSRMQASATSASNAKTSANKKILGTLGKKAQTAYKKHLNSAISSIKSKKAVSSGIINYFLKINPSLAAKYLSWNTQLVNLENARAETADNFAENMATIVNNIAESYANLDEQTQNAISYAQSQAENMVDYRDANNVLDRLYKYQNTIIENDKSEISKYASYMKSYGNAIKTSGYTGNMYKNAFAKTQTAITNLRNKVIKAVNSNEMISETDMLSLYNYFSSGYVSQAFYEACRSWNLSKARSEEAAAQLLIDEETRKQENKSTFGSKFSNIENYYSNRISEIEAKKSSIHGSYDDSVTQGRIISENTNKVNELREALQIAMDNGIIEKGSTEWYEYSLKIQEAENEIHELESTRFEIILAEKFDRAIQKAQEFIDKLDTIKDLISDEMLYDLDNGQFTEYGWMSLGLDSQAMAKEQSNLELYFKKRQEIIDAYAEGNAKFFGDQSYDEMINENAEDILSAISNINSYRESILDLLEGQSDAELEALQKVIDKRKEALQKKKEYYDYDRTIKGKTKDLQSLEQQIRALEGVAGQEAAAKRANLMAQRKEMQEDLDDTIKEHIYSMQVEGLDDMMNGLQEDLEEWKKELRSDIEKQTQAINSIIASVGNSADESSIAGLLSSISKKTITSENVSSLLNEYSETLQKDNDDVETVSINGEEVTVVGNVDNRIDTNPTDTISELATTTEDLNKKFKELSDGINDLIGKNVQTAKTVDIPTVSGSNAGSSNGGTSGGGTKTASTNTQKSSGVITGAVNKAISSVFNTVQKAAGISVTAAKAKDALKKMVNGLTYASSESKSWGKLNTTLWHHKDFTRKVFVPKADQIKAWKALGYSEKSFTTDKLLAELKKSGAWTQLLKVRTSGKTISTSGIDYSKIHGYAKGGTVHRSGRYLTDEKGEEIIITKQGILRPLSAGTSVIPADITERLYSMASNYDMGASSRIHGIDTSKLVRIGGDTISPIINCPITIEGNANEQDVINAINKTLPKISKHVQNDIRKDLRKSGR